MKGAGVLATAALLGCGGVVEMVRQDQERYQANERSCAAGDAAGCTALGERELGSYAGAGAGRGDPLALARARGHFQRACDLGSAPGCLGLSEVLARGPSRPGEAVSAARRACELGLAAGCVAVVDLGRRERVGADPALLTRACELDPTACPGAAERALYVDRALAAALASRPCERGLAEPCARSAEVPLPDELRDRLYVRACELGTPSACLTGAARVEKQDLALAEKLYRRGCVAGLAHACGGLGRLLTAATAD